MRCFIMDMFWDGRASFVFNGVNPFGFRDRESTVKRIVDGVIQDVFVRIPLAGHASQSVGPPLSTLEMTGHERDFLALAKNLLDDNLNPLALQMVHPEDSVLGPYAMAYYEVNKKGRQTGKLINVPGTKNPNLDDPVDPNDPENVTLTYRYLVERIFKEEWWDGDVLDPGTDDERTHDGRKLLPVLRPGHAAVPGQSGGG
jgi:hypothetical protein